MSAQPQDAQQRMAIEEFLAFEEAHPEGRYEYIGGYLRDLDALLIAGGTNNHAAIAVNVSTALTMGLRAKGKRCRVFSADVTFRPDATTYLHPDVTVSCDSRDLSRNDAIEHPSLVVEVLSPSTEGFDHTQKLRMYNACPAIQEYLLVDAAHAMVEVYHRVPNGHMEYRAYGAGDTIMLTGIGFDITVADIYFDLDVEE